MTVKEFNDLSLDLMRLEIKCHEQVQEVLDEYKDTEFWKRLYISAGSDSNHYYAIGYVGNYGIPNGNRIIFHPIDGAKESFVYYYMDMDAGERGQRYEDLLQEIIKKINRATALIRFRIKKTMEESPDLTLR